MKSGCTKLKSLKVKTQRDCKAVCLQFSEKEWDYAPEFKAKYHEVGIVKENNSMESACINTL